MRIEKALTRMGLPDQLLTIYSSLTQTNFRTFVPRMFRFAVVSIVNFLGRGKAFLFNPPRKQILVFPLKFKQLNIYRLF